ncbi:MAG: hypothetical protein J6V24_08840 [Clostridia bacterium]|nr:hypothetical protein [Clostridia bacterium]
MRRKAAPMSVRMPLKVKASIRSIPWLWATKDVPQMVEANRRMSAPLTFERAFSDPDDIDTSCDFDG